MSLAPVRRIASRRQLRLTGPQVSRPIRWSKEPGGQLALNLVRRLRGALGAQAIGNSQSEKQRLQRAHHELEVLLQGSLLRGDEDLREVQIHDDRLAAVALSVRHVLNVPSGGRSFADALHHQYIAQSCN